MSEIWEKNDKLIDKQEWGHLIDNLYSDNIINNHEEAKKVLREKLLTAIKLRIPAERFGIFFSGGVDSTFIAAICKRVNANFVCYSVGFQDEETKEPEDITEAKKVAAKLGFELKYKIFNLEEAEEIIKKTVQILKPVHKTDVVNVGVGAVVLAAAELGKANSVNYFFGGLGSEEIFAGYERHAKSTGINEECWSGLKNMWERDLVRDFNLANHLHINVKTPFLDQDLIITAMQIPSRWKLFGDEKKIILREVAREFLGDFSQRPKKAAQYGSCFDKAIAKLAKKNGFKLKKDYLDSL